MNDNPYTAHGDEPVEARIVAWVLGEASPFEVEELQRLCDERPELAIFKRRMEAMHGMLNESAHPVGDADWKLPASKRAPIEALLGAQANLEQERRIRHSGRRAFWAIAACFALTLVVARMLKPIFWVSRTAMREPEMSNHMMAAGEHNGRMVPFSEVSDMEVPPELIEGTPKPMNVPGLVDPSKQMEGWVNSKKTKSAAAENEELQLSVDDRVAGARDGLAMADSEPARGLKLSGGNTFSGASSYFKQDKQAEVAKAEAALRESDDAMTRSRIVPPPVVANPAPSVSSAPSSPKGQSYADASGPAALPKAPAAKLRAKSETAVAAGGTLSLPGDALKSERKESTPKEMDEDYGARRGFLYLSDGDKDGLAGQKMPSGQFAGPAPKVGNAQMLGDIPETGALFKNANENSELDLYKGEDVQSSTHGQLSDVRQGGLKTDLSNIIEGQDALTLNYDLGRDKKQNEKLADKPADFDDKKSDSELAKREMIRRGNTAVESDRLFADGRNAYANGNYEQASQAYAEALAKLPDTPMFENRRREVAQQLDKVKEAQAKPVADEKVVKEFIELAAADEPYSTFSLNISDASFQVAQAALAKGEQPDPAGIQVEQFYNAVDYGDPSPGAGQPVAGTVEQVAHPVIPGRNLVRVAIKTAASGRSAGQPLHLTLLADQSGSMGREDRREAMERALASLAELLTEKDIVSVIGFARTPHLLADGMNGKDAGKLKGMINQEASEGGTNLEEAIKLAEQLAKRHQEQGAQNRIVLFTDGAANLGDADPESLAKKVKQLRQDGIAFDIAGIAADGLNDELLGELARNGNGRYYVMGKGATVDFAKQLAGAFRPAAENVKVQVHFNPERVGHYKLVGFEKDRLKKEDFRNDAVDAAEMAAEEAGVAIYQVEPLADGNGELGEVSVRFRDTASGQMVERTWAIPYDASVPSLDHSVPSMQLATLAMLAGEKLKGGPLADAIDFKQFVNVMANVKQHYGPSGRVGEVLQMVNTLK